MDPTTICDDNQSCTPPMLSIVQEYKKGGAAISNQTLSGFSGGCYYLSSLYSSEHKHHGAFVFERAGDNLAVTGIFSFFTKDDPYQNMNSIEMKNWLIQNGYPFSQAVESDREVELRFLTDQSDFHYWFRSNSEMNKIFVIGEQFSAGKNTSLFCEMNAR